MELLLVSLVLFTIMRTLGITWISVPAGIILGNGILLGYYSLTDWWHHWAFLWPLEPLLVVGSVIYGIRLASDRESAPQLSRRLGQTAGRLALWLSLFVALVAFVLG